MSSTVKEILAANALYAESFDAKAQLPMPPGRRFLILTCMDARLDPAKFAGLSEGDAHVFLNAGGRVAEEAIRSLATSHKFLGTREWFILHPTDCGRPSFCAPFWRALIDGGVDVLLAIAQCFAANLREVQSARQNLKSPPPPAQSQRPGKKHPKYQVPRIRLSATSISPSQSMGARRMSPRAKQREKRVQPSAIMPSSEKSLLRVRFGKLGELPRPWISDGSRRISACSWAVGMVAAEPWRPTS